MTATELRPPVGNNSPQLAADPTDERFVVAAHRRDAPEFDCALQVSGDGGGSWIPASPVEGLPEEVDHCYAPQVAFGPDGTLYYLFVGLAGPGNEPVGAYLTTSTDRAKKFSPPEQVLGADNFAVRMAIDQEAGDKGRVHLVWLEARSDTPVGGFGPPPNPIMAAHSDDGGETFSDPVQVSDPDRQRVVAPALALGPDGAVHVAYYDLRDDARDYQGLEGPVWPGAWSLVATRSTDGGETFTDGTVVSDDVKPTERVLLIFTMPPPALAAGPDSGVYAGWHDARNGDGDVFVAASGDGGASWRDPVRVNDDELGNGRRQELPELAVAPTGRVDAVFYDRRHDPDNVANHLYYTHSTDQGRNFADNVRLTSRDSDTLIGQRYLVPSAEGRHEFGSHPALLTRSGSVLAAWTDTRHASRGTNQQDVFATTVSLGGGAPAGGGGGGLAVPAAAGLAGLGVLAGLWLGVRRWRAARHGPDAVASDPAGLASSEGGDAPGCRGTAAADVTSPGAQRP